MADLSAIAKKLDALCLSFEGAKESNPYDPESYRMWSVGEMHVIADLREDHIEALAVQAPDEWERFAMAYCEWRARRSPSILAM